MRSGLKYSSTIRSWAKEGSARFLEAGRWYGKVHGSSEPSRVSSCRLKVARDAMPRDAADAGGLHDGATHIEALDAARVFNAKDRSCGILLGHVGERIVTEKQTAASCVCVCLWVWCSRSRQSFGRSELRCRDQLYFYSEPHCPTFKCRTDHFSIEPPALKFTH